MTILKTIVTIMDVLLILMIWFCSKDFTWQQDKANVIGFSYMVITIGMSSVLMWV